MKPSLEYSRRPGLVLLREKESNDLQRVDRTLPQLSTRLYDSRSNMAYNYSSTFSLYQGCLCTTIVVGYPIMVKGSVVPIGSIASALLQSSLTTPRTYLTLKSK